MVVSDFPGSPRGCEWGTRTLPADGCVPWGFAGIAGVSFSCWVLFSPAAHGVVPQNLPLQVAVACLQHWAQHLVPTEAMHRCSCCGVEHGCCLLGWFGEAVPAGRWGFCLCVSSLTPLPLLSVLLFCLNGADALLLGGLLFSFQAFGFGVYCFSFSPPCVNRHSRWQPV